MDRTPPLGCKKPSYGGLAGSWSPGENQHRVLIRGAHATKTLEGRTRARSDRAERLAQKYGMTVEQAREAEQRLTDVAAGEGLDFRFDIAHSDGLACSRLQLPTQVVAAINATMPSAITRQSPATSR